ncbi:MAG TPA: PLP-dependent aminotransferase family protein, partial [Chitinophagaceae bacterium]|nr:PLP-dependent aminotransferase family protein [Chitinophagaceae bacterium]
CMPDEHKKEAVRILEKFNVPLIENDLNGDIYFGSQRPKSCKTYDESGLVMWCGSVSKSLAPGYRVGWVEAGKFKDKVQQVKLYHSISSTAITQEVVSRFLENGRYETHLRKLRHTLYTNYLQYIKLINDCFPGDTLVSQPQGGFVLWVELNKKVNTVELYEKALLQKISIAPGKMFTLTDQFSNCMRLNYGLVWNERTETGLRILGKLIKGMS